MRWMQMLGVFGDAQRFFGGIQNVISGYIVICRKNRSRPPLFPPAAVSWSIREGTTVSLQGSGSSETRHASRIVPCASSAMQVANAFLGLRINIYTFSYCSSRNVDGDGTVFRNFLGFRAIHDFLGGSIHEGPLLGGVHATRTYFPSLDFWKRRKILTNLWASSPLNRIAPLSR